MTRARDLITRFKLQDNFYIANLTVLQNKIDQWKELLPRVSPFYAVKCNPDKEIINMMIKNGLGFDCASKKEIESVIKSGCDPSKIMFMHPFKSPKDIQYAISNNVSITTFDSYTEMDKIKQNAPDIRCLIRIKVNNPTARVQLGLKYGIDISEYKAFVDYAREINMNLVGICYHVGSASKDPNVFKNGMDYSKEVLAYAREKGFTMSVLDIGGGFTTENFEKCAEVINKEIQDIGEDIQIVAEPGRYFASDVFTFYTPITGYKKKNQGFNYYIKDGLYGSFNCILYDGQEPEYGYLRNPLSSEEGSKVESDEILENVLWGVTCDSHDHIGNVNLPKLNVGDFIECKNFGAYTISGAMDFNGLNMSNPQIFYLFE